MQYRTSKDVVAADVAAWPQPGRGPAGGWAIRAVWALAPLWLTACGGASVAHRASASSVGVAAKICGPGELALAETRPVEMDLGAPLVAPAHQVWLKLVDSARSSLDIGQFYIANRPGSRLDRVIGRIAAAVGRGVHVRVLVDAKFAPKYPKTLARLRALSGRGAGQVEVRELRAFGRLGGILHAKYFVVDRKRAWLGSQNFDWRSLTHIHELGVQIAIPDVVAALQATFDRDWQAAAPGARGPAPGPRVAVAQAIAAAASPRFYPGSWRGERVQVAAVGSPVGHLPGGMAWDLPALIAWLDGAKRGVRLQVLSMHRHARDGSDFGLLYDALTRAAKRGVKVHVLVGEWSTSRRSAAELSVLQRVPNLTVRFVRVPRHSGGFIPFARVIHSKVLVVDEQRAWVGTSNWSKGYFTTSRNVGVLVRGAGFARLLAQVVDRLWRSPYAETLVPGKVYPRVRVAR